MSDTKTCYIIGPIGEPDSPQRQWADFLRDHVIEPVVTTCGYAKPERADDPHTDSMIMPGVVAQMFEADLVVADLTGDNPNVYYELGIRHCARKPVIHVKRTGEKIPFDLGGNKAIPVDDKHLAVMKAIEDIKARIHAIHENPNEFFSHVHQYLMLKKVDAQVLESGTMEKNIGGVLTGMAASLTQMAELQRKTYDELDKLRAAETLSDFTSWSPAQSWSLNYPVGKRRILFVDPSSPPLGLQLDPTKQPTMHIAPPETQGDQKS